MAPFSVAELKGRASDRVTAARDKYSSTSSSSPGYNPPRPSTKPPIPPPPAPRNRALPTSAPISAATPNTHNDSTVPEKIDWANLTEEDKQIFFAWLDEFFSGYLGRPISSTTMTKSTAMNAVSAAFLQRREASSSSESVPALPGRSPVPPSLPYRRDSNPSPSSASPPLPSRRTPSQVVSTSLTSLPPPPPRQRSSPPALSSSAPLMPARRSSSSRTGSTSLSSPEPPSLPLRQSSAKSPLLPKRNMPPPPPAAGPPRINYATKPPAPPPTLSLTSPDPTTDLNMSFPPRSLLESSAADLARYISVQTSWSATDNWYNSDSPLPTLPPGISQDQIRTEASTGILGSTSTLSGYLLFADLSVCYYRIIYPNSPHLPSDPRVQRKAWYTHRPSAMTAGALVRASSIYGEDIASFAEDYEGTGQYAGDGECWTLASEAIQHAMQRHPEQVLVPSLSRTHGHLVYCGRPGIGRWRGGDTRIRRGDIVEWRTARVEHGRSWSTLGDPEHTAVIVDDCVPSVFVSDGASIPPSKLSTLTVIEQSVGSPPKRMSYALQGFVAGEIWVYRPVAMREYTGVEFEVEPPLGAPVVEA